MFYSFDAFLDHRNFYHDLVVQRSQRLPLTNNALVVGRDHFSTHIPVHDVTDRLVMIDHIFITADAFLSHQAWIGGYPVQDAEILCLSDLIQIGCVDKEFHLFWKYILYLIYCDWLPRPSGRAMHCIAKQK